MDTFLGCLTLSNNTAELSAVPHIMAAVLTWRTRNIAPHGLQLRTSEEIGVLMVYDSQYTKDQCTAPRATGHARHMKNATAIAVCRRMIQAVTDRRVITRWVKVKGHSEHEGNDAADQRATWAQNGGSKNESDINSIMAYLRQQG
jgi:ribonuclease HI